MRASRVAFPRVAPTATAGLGYAVPKFRELGINTPLALMNLTFEDFDAGASAGCWVGRK